MRSGDAWMDTLPFAPDDQGRCALTLSGLARICTELEEMYRRAATSPGVADYRPAFLAYAQQRVHFADELRLEARRLRAAPPGLAVVPREPLERAWLEGSDPLAVFTGCVGAEERCERAYVAALATQLPPAAEALVVWQLEEASVAHRHVRMIRGVVQLRGPRCAPPRTELCAVRRETCSHESCSTEVP